MIWAVSYTHLAVYKRQDYTFNSETEAMLQKIFIRDSDKVVICEKNVDWLSESSVIISCSGTLRELEKGKDYTVQAKGSETEKKEYTYTIDKSCFQNEGTYVIYVDSKDKAGNHSSIAVSYTHLDVYKRQVKGQGLSADGG